MSNEANVPDHLQKYKELFDEHMKFVDKPAQIIMSGHLIIENALDNIIDLLLFHPEYLRTARLTFYQKLQIARGLALRKNNLTPWGLISAINEVRNAIAHNLTGNKRTRNFAQLRRIYLADSKSEFQERLKDAEDDVIGYFACLEAVGFLGTLEHDLKALRGYIDGIDAVMQEVKKAQPD